MHSAIKGEMQENFSRVYDSTWFVIRNKVDHFESTNTSFLSS